MALLCSSHEIEGKLASSIQQPVSGAFWGEQRLGEVMAYSLLSGGKRLRPILVMECARLCAPQLSAEKVESLASPAALAIEYVHSYSIIHDDLPAMDDDDFRRGQPSSHKAFTEAAAILAGDALLTDAFALLAAAELNAAQQCLELARAAGSGGMVAGQFADIAGTKEPRLPGIDEWLEIHERKTARLISCACVLGATSVGAESAQIELLRRFGLSVGLAFQLQDDVLDNSPLVQLIGAKKIKQLAEIELQKALNALSSFSIDSAELKRLALFAVERVS